MPWPWCWRIRSSSNSSARCRPFPTAIRGWCCWKPAPNHDWEDEDWHGQNPGVASVTSPAGPLRSFLEQHSKAELVDLFEELAGRFPELHAALDDRRTLATGTAEQLVGDSRRLIVTIGAEPGWRNHWDGEGSIPDYGPIRDRLELLLGQGYADDVVSLGETLLDTGISQVEQSHDEGETHAEIAGCMNIVFRALLRSSLQPSAQLLWAIDAMLRDQYELCAGADVVIEQAYTAADWSIVADNLRERLLRTPAASRREDFSAAFARERLSSWLITALEHAERGDEIIPLAEREAELNGDYVRLVKLLIAAGRTAEAEQWIARGIEALAQTQRGTVRMLRDLLLELRRQAGDHSTVAAMRAEDFFQQPSMMTLQELKAAAEQAGVWTDVQAAAMHYLETGEPPTGEGAQSARTRDPGLAAARDRPAQTGTTLAGAVPDARPVDRDRRPRAAARACVVLVRSAAGRASPV